MYLAQCQSTSRHSEKLKYMNRMILTPPLQRVRYTSNNNNPIIWMLDYRKKQRAPWGDHRRKEYQFYLGQLVRTFIPWSPKTEMWKVALASYSQSEPEMVKFKEWAAQTEKSWGDGFLHLVQATSGISFDHSVPLSWLWHRYTSVDNNQSGGMHSLQWGICEDHKIACFRPSDPT